MVPLVPVSCIIIVVEPVVDVVSVAVPTLSSPQALAIATADGEGTLSYDTSLQHRLGAVGQAALWLLVLLAWRRLRRRPVAEAEPAPEPAGHRAEAIVAEEVDA